MLPTASARKKEAKGGRYDFKVGDRILHKLPVYVNHHFLTAFDEEGGAPVVGHDVSGKLLVSAVFVFAYEPCEGNARDLPDNEEIELAVVGLRVRYGVEASAVVAAVAGADEAKLALKYGVAQLYPEGAGDAL